MSPLIGLIMGSKSDWETLKVAAEQLDALGVPYEAKVVSAHRTPKRLYDYATTAKARGLKVIVAAAGGAAHLPGMTAALTPLPVLGVPIKSKELKGLDSLLSIVQMPKGVPVGTLAIAGLRFSANNAGMTSPLLAAAVSGATAKSIWPAMVIWIDSAGPRNGTRLNGTLVICESSSIDK